MILSLVSELLARIARRPAVEHAAGEFDPGDLLVARRGIRTAAGGELAAHLGLGTAAERARRAEPGATAELLEAR